MNMRVMVGVLVAFVAFGTFARAQQQTGEIFGRVTDQSGAVIPGVTVALTSPILLQPSSQSRAIQARTNSRVSKSLTTQ